jgi:hypothetical protein
LWLQFQGERYPILAIKVLLFRRDKRQGGFTSFGEFMTIERYTSLATLTSLFSDVLQLIDCHRQSADLAPIG